MKTAEVIDHIVEWIQDYSSRSGTNGFVVGVSGGIDSAVVSTLCARTGKRVVLMEMPIHQSKEQIDRAHDHMAWLQENYPNVSSLTLNLTESYDGLVRSLEAQIDLHADVDKKLLTLSNLRSRLRMVSLYALAGLEGLLVCGTGNKVEDFGVGFYTKYGDGGVDISPIADLMKSEVYRLGEVLGVNTSILEARPTDGLWDDGRTDEDQIGATYAELEWAMNVQEMHGDEPPESVFENDRQQKVWEIYISRHKTNKHKTEPIPICIIPENLR